MKYLIHYSTIEEFSDFIINKLHIEYWWVVKLDIETRINKVKNNKYFEFLKNLAEEKNIKANDLEILSWLDTLNQLYYTLDDLKTTHNNIQIIQEFEVPFTNKRIDYLLCYKNKILILEFSLAKYGEKYSYQHKLSQAIQYKELLSNILPNSIKIGTFTFIINYEKNNDEIIKKESIYSNKKVVENTDNQIKLFEYIQYFFDDDINAYNELKNRCENINKQIQLYK